MSVLRFDSQSILLPREYPMEMPAKPPIVLQNTDDSENGLPPQSRGIEPPMMLPMKRKVKMSVLVMRFRMNQWRVR